MDKQETLYINDAAKCVDYIIDNFGKKIVLGMPLALGKSYQMANEFYRRAKADPEIQLLIVTALSLEKPTGSSELERRIVEPLAERIWEGVPDFDYMLDLRKDGLPPNVALKEFYFRAGSFVHTPVAQQNHYSSNYTHVPRDMINELIENRPDWTFVACQLVARQEIDGKTYYSDSCNADLNNDFERLIPIAEELGLCGIVIGQVNNNLPFMYGDAVHDAGFFDIIIDNDQYHFPLFSVPKEPVMDAEHMIGLHVSTLIKDGGTLQVGIGSLGDAISYGLLLRHHEPDVYRRIVDDLGISSRYGALIDRIGGLDSFEAGLYGSTEMLVGVFIDLYKGGVLKRKVFPSTVIQRHLNEGVLYSAITREAAETVLQADELNPVIKEKWFNNLQYCGFFKDALRYEDYCIVDGDRRYSADLRDDANRQAILENCIGETLQNGIVAHGSFFIGARKFYEALRSMSEAERRQFIMTGVNYVNQLYGDEEIKRLQRKDGRFVNAGMKISIMGNIASDALADGTVISGVGGQYNFVSMAHALEDGRLIMMIKSTKEHNGEVQSNIVFNYGYTTIPRHLKDIVVTEYGIADLRGKVDQDVVKALINVADSRFQEDLLAKAKKVNKVPKDYEIPREYRNNYPWVIGEKLAPYRAEGRFQAFPSGTDFTEEEVVLTKSLRKFKQEAAKNKLAALKGVFGRFARPVPDAARPYLDRMALDQPNGFKEKMLRNVVLTALDREGVL
ncbi:MAG: acetyl-CoA hydrolase/transferase C-terminal domain-containing protein [Thermodesulfobacteriota bacterium]|nr:acetyl-CoA hydrolase/transferase C-terminal domain-containing protein [Thermodesulfobacteriota bacterium]